MLTLTNWLNNKLKRNTDEENTRLSKYRIKSPIKIQ